MEQVSNVKFRAEKMYKNAREGFGYVLRETVSNAIHAAVIRLNKEQNITPTVKIKISIDKDSAEILIEDNGEGFTNFNRKCFTHLDYINVEKQKYHFFPQGQGRLAIIYFTDGAIYTSTYKSDHGTLQEISFHYPMIENSLFNIEDTETQISTDQATGTKLKLYINKQQTFNRIKTFFLKQHDSSEKLKYWFIDNFLPFFIEFQSLCLNIEYLSDVFSINKATIEEDITRLSFDVLIPAYQNKKTNFNILIIDTNENSNKKNTVFCYARHLQAELTSGKLEYDIDLQKKAYWIVTSDFFDCFVDPKGDKIEILYDDIIKIQDQLNITLDIYYKKEIEKNREETKQNIKKTVQQYHSLKAFIDEEKIIQSKKITKTNDIVNEAIDQKAKIEKAYWLKNDIPSSDSDKLLNSSLHIYVAHRERVLEQFHSMLLRFTDDGENNNISEEEIHNLFLKRGIQLSNADNINHLHNLWLLDDKYTVFSQTTKALSSKRGQPVSDIYLWIDDPEKVKELLILELKSTTSAHNAGDKYDSIVAQVKRYAAQFYRSPQKVLAWDTNPEKILYSGIILARKSDIYKELNSNNTSGNSHKIPFLQDSYFYNDKFSIAENDFSPPVYKDIRIDLLSFEDVYNLSKTRNKVFFKLLNGEYETN
ncbi:ATP-binding protein [Treponema phagedenis]|uniref:ATP-binding protein n=1 Tax=Treponema phagedenis TaxID=162 RepID=UPI0001F63E84|nr:ATP-binding protein [Treponema phagedenis]EFW37910.1 hypothetical protein HMPREF9554_01601 [Treponema phagedenis F0421]QSH99164.1 ATP-binding protein [Treponema phagedenis]TYT79785.1 ATP-binding protein [Treponema phagedenis]